MIRLGTRSSILAIAQAKLIAEQISCNLIEKVTIVKISSLGDKDLISKLTDFRGQGVFTSSLESALAENRIDIAVHSLKDLPVQVRDDLPIIAYCKRHSPGDTLLVKSELIKNRDPLELEAGVRIATGSPRRQSQFLDQFPSAIPIDIRGNIQTRISRLQSSFIDALIIATAIFDRIIPEIPENITRIDLDPHLFPPAPGQAVIAVQVRKGEYSRLSVLNDKITEDAVLGERKLLNNIGASCELSFGALIKPENGNWRLITSYAGNQWTPGSPLNLSRFDILRSTIEKLKVEFLKYYQSSEKVEENTALEGKIIALARSPDHAKPYHDILTKSGAIVISNPIMSYQTNWELLSNEELQTCWNNAEWIVVSSQRTVPFLNALHQVNPISKRYAVIGQKTATKLREYNFPVHIVSTGNMKDLNRHLENALNFYSGDILYLHGEDFYNKPKNTRFDFSVYKAKIQKIDFGLKPDYLVVFSERSTEAIIDQLGINVANRWVTIGQSTYELLLSRGISPLRTRNISPKGILEAIQEDVQ